MLVIVILNLEDESEVKGTSVDNCIVKEHITYKVVCVH